MVDSVDVVLEDSCSDDNKSDGPYACADEKRGHHDEKQQQTEQQHGDREEHVNFTDIDSDLESLSSESDDDLREAELRLEAMKQEQKLLYKQSKRARIAQETEAVAKSLRKLKKEGKHGASRSPVTVKSLRAMEDVVEEVDQLMDRNMRIKTVDSSECETDCVSSSSAAGKPRRNNSHPSNVRKGSQQENKSGKSKNSLTSDYKFPQMWPHSFLNPHLCTVRRKIMRI